MGTSGVAGADEARRHRENMKRGGISAWRQKGGMSSWRGGRTWRKCRKIRQALFGLPRQGRCVLSDPPAVADRRFRCAESAGSRKGFPEFLCRRRDRHAVFSPFFMLFFLSAPLLQTGGLCCSSGVGLQSPEKFGILTFELLIGAGRATVGTACGCGSTRTHDKACRRTAGEAGIPPGKPPLPAKRNRGGPGGLPPGGVRGGALLPFLPFWHFRHAADDGGVPFYRRS